MNNAKPQANAYAGYGHFGDEYGGNFGSFEVFWHEPHINEGDDPPMDQPGWFWWACFPGRLPDGAPSGPFDTSYRAYLSARDGGLP